MDEKKSYHMSPEDFRRHGREVIDWIADYHENVERYPVLSRVRPGEIADSLDTEVPAQGEAFDQILRDTTERILPGLTHWRGS